MNLEKSERILLATLEFLAHILSVNASTNIKVTQSRANVIHNKYSTPSITICSVGVRTLAFQAGRPEFNPRSEHY